MVVGDKVIDGNCHGLLGEELKISLGKVQNVVDEVLDVDFLVLVRVNRLSKQFVELLASLVLDFFRLRLLQSLLLAEQQHIRRVRNVADELGPEALVIQRAEPGVLNSQPHHNLFRLYELDLRLC